MSADLRLSARDAKDLEILSAVLQDAVLKVGDIAYLKARRRFALVANRFVWEEAEKPRRKRAPFLRVRTGLHFEDVLGVQAHRIRRDDPDAVLELLAIRFEPEAPEDPENPAGHVELVFAGGGAIKLHVECLEAHLRDMGAPWPTKHKPEHPDVDEPGGAPGEEPGDGQAR